LKEGKVTCFRSEGVGHHTWRGKTKGSILLKAAASARRIRSAERDKGGTIDNSYGRVWKKKDQ